MEPKTGKQIVSKGEYAAMKILALGLSGSSVLCILFPAVLLLNFAFIYYKDAQAQVLCHSRRCSMVQMDDSGWEVAGAFIYLSCTFPLLPIAYASWRGSRNRWKAVHTMQPLTRANTADLPAFNTLARASFEPPQAQQAVLLRAAAQGHETPLEQLVRPAGGLE